MGAVSSASVHETWAFGPQPGASSRRGWRPFGLAAGAVAGLGVAAVAGFLAFVTVAGSGNESPARSTTQASDSAPEAPPPVRVEDVRLTDAFDTVTGEPARELSSFGMDEPVNLWLSFDSSAADESLTAVWFRGDNAIARLTAPLPEASQMVFPLPQVAVDRPGLYRVEVRSRGDVLATESFEVTDD